MRIIFRLVFAFFLLSTSVFAAEQEAATFSQLLNNIKSMQAHFQQTVHDKRGKVTEKSSGTMAMQRPYKFRWQITRPQPQVIIASESKIWIYDPDLEQLTIRRLQKSSGETPAFLLSHDDKSLESRYQIKNLENEKSTLHWYLLTSREKNTLFKKMQIGFLNNQIKEMRLQDNLGHETVIKFTDVQTNIALSNALFSIKPPANVDVIDETRKK